MDEIPLEAAEEMETGEAEIEAVGALLFPTTQPDLPSPGPSKALAVSNVSVDAVETLPFDPPTDATPSPRPSESTMDLAAMDARIAFLQTLGV